MKETIRPKLRNIFRLIFVIGVALAGVSRSQEEGKVHAEFCAADQRSSERKKVEFFEKLYEIKIKGVKALEEYREPDSFYAAIARQVGIPKKAFEAVNKKYGWKQNDDFLLSAMVKGGWDADYWGVMVTKVPMALKESKSKEEKIKLLKRMEMKMVVIGYDGSISFPDEPDPEDAVHTD